VVVTAPGLNVTGTGQSGAPIQGPNGHASVLDGSAGNDTLIAGNSATDLIGGPKDILTGNKGADTYVFMGDFGSDAITNYNSAKDLIQLDASHFANLAAIQADASQIGANTAIQDGSHGTVTLIGVQLSSLHFNATHFVFGLNRDRADTSLDAARPAAKACRIASIWDRKVQPRFWDLRARPRQSRWLKAHLADAPIGSLVLCSAKGRVKAEYFGLNETKRRLETAPAREPQGARPTRYARTCAGGRCPGTGAWR
jgi:hypothetical protein